jgi:hypothetical protein
MKHLKIPLSGYLDDGEEYKILHGDCAEMASGELVEFRGHVVQVTVTIQTANRLFRPIGESWHNTPQIQPSGRASIAFNNISVYGFIFADITDALRKADSSILRLLDLPCIDKWDREGIEEALLGRRIYYYEQPAKIATWYGADGSVFLHPDNEERKFLPFSWERGVPDFQQPNEGIKEDILSPHINWFRNE